MRFILFVLIFLAVVIGLTSGENEVKISSHVDITFQWIALAISIAMLMMGILTRSFKWPKMSYRQVACVMTVIAAISSFVSFLGGISLGSQQVALTVLSLIVTILSGIAAISVVKPSLGRNAFYTSATMSVAIGAFTCVFSIAAVSV